jgi:hypothetical protein
VGSSPIRVVKDMIAEAITSFINIWDLSSAGRASALQAEGHRFEPYRSHCSPCWCGGIGRRKGLKILREQSRAGSSPATSIILLENPQFRLKAEVDSFFRLKYLIVLEGEISYRKIENNQRNFLLKIIEWKIMMKFVEKKMG